MNVTLALGAEQQITNANVHNIHNNVLVNVHTYYSM